MIWHAPVLASPHEQDLSTGRNGPTRPTAATLLSAQGPARHNGKTHRFMTMNTYTRAPSCTTTFTKKFTKGQELSEHRGTHDHDVTRMMIPSCLPVLVPLDPQRSCESIRERCEDLRSGPTSPKADELNVVPLPGSRRAAGFQTATRADQARPRHCQVRPCRRR